MVPHVVPGKNMVCFWNLESATYNIIFNKLNIIEGFT
jgi:hypothetical protein